MTEEELSAIPDLETTTNSSSNEGSSDLHLGSVDFDNTIPYLYSKYNDEANVEAHVRAFSTTWQVNHVFQRLASADVDALKIAEF